MAPLLAALPVFDKGAGECRFSKFVIPMDDAVADDAVSLVAVLVLSPSKRWVVVGGQ